jgi:hypothetical protein
MPTGTLFVIAAQQQLLELQIFFPGLEENREVTCEASDLQPHEW